MHFHLPKPLHGWRAFVGEVGIIVVGVLIALAAEQVVEHLNWDAKTGRAEDLIAAELGQSLAGADERILIRPCLDRQLDALKQRVITEKPAPLYEAKAFSTVYRFPMRPWVQTTWQSAITEQTVSHMSTEKRDSLSTAYRDVARLVAWNDEENEFAGRVNVLADGLRLEPTDKTHFVEMIDEEKARIGAMALISAQLIQTAKATGIRPYPAYLVQSRSADTTYAWCRANRFL